MDQDRQVQAAPSDMPEQNGTLPNDALPGTPADPLHKILTVPNILTLCRLALTLAFLFMFPFEHLRTPAIVLYIIAAATDFFDGQLARHLHQVSIFGKRMDPVMDRVLIFSGVLGLILADYMPVWILVFLAVRDIYLGLGGLYLNRSLHISIDVCYVGKACTFVLLVGFAILLFQLFPVPGLGLFDVSWLPGFGSESVSLGMWVIYVGCVLSLCAAIIYTVRGVRAFKTYRRSNING